MTVAPFCVVLLTSTSWRESRSCTILTSPLCDASREAARIGLVHVDGLAREQEPHHLDVTLLRRDQYTMPLDPPTMVVHGELCLGGAPGGLVRRELGW